MATEILDYLRNDRFAGSLGIDIEAVEPGYARASVSVTDAMTNFHGTTHGGLIFTLAAQAVAYRKRESFVTETKSR